MNRNCRLSQTAVTTVLDLRLYHNRLTLRSLNFLAGKPDLADGKLHINCSIRFFL